MRNVTTTCNVTVMDNVTGKCQECGNTMHGRVDRRFCSAACRQKAYRNSRHETATHNVTAEPFPLCDDPTPYKDADDFWRAVYSLPDMLGGLSIFDSGSDYESYGHDERPLVSLYPPRRKAKDLAQEDVRRAVDGLRDFMRAYDDMAANLPRVRATVEAIAKHHGYDLEHDSV